jgi:hypothetical protein
MHVLSDSTSKGGGFSGPHFGAEEEEVEFEVTHIPDRRGTSEPHTYRERNVHIFIPEKFEDTKPHLDPDFDNFTYGESGEKRRIAMIKGLDPGDYIFFAASLAPTSRGGYQDRSNTAIQHLQKGRMAKYLVGHFQVQCWHTVQRKGLIEPKIRPEDACMDLGSRLRRNAHFRTQDSHDFVCVVGVDDRRTARLKRAIRFTGFGSPFYATSFGIAFQGPHGFPRGWKKLREDQVEAGLSRVRHLADR